MYHFTSYQCTSSYRRANHHKNIIFVDPSHIHCVGKLSIDLWTLTCHLVAFIGLLHKIHYLPLHRMCPVFSKKVFKKLSLHLKQEEIRKWLQGNKPMFSSIFKWKELFQIHSVLCHFPSKHIEQASSNALIWPYGFSFSKPWKLGRIWMRLAIGVNARASVGSTMQESIETLLSIYISRSGVLDKSVTGGGSLLPASSAITLRSPQFQCL